jgi:hypothetical protein
MLLALYNLCNSNKREKRGAAVHTVIKGTSTIEEYKKLKALMEQRSKEHYESHKNAFENWQEGNIAKIWIDGQGNLCIEYESGK